MIPALARIPREIAKMRKPDSLSAIEDWTAQRG